MKKTLVDINHQTPSSRNQVIRVKIRHTNTKIFIQVADSLDSPAEPAASAADSRRSRRSRPAGCRRSRYPVDRLGAIPHLISRKGENKSRAAGFRWFPLVNLVELFLGVFGALKPPLPDCLAFQVAVAMSFAELVINR